MNKKQGASGLIFNEPLIWERSSPGRTGFSMPANDTGDFAPDENLIGSVPDFPEVSEVDIVRHYTRLSQWNYSVDSGLYPLGSCTMKYNPRINEREAALNGFSGAHPFLPGELSQGVLKLLYELETYLAEIFGMDAVSLQPSAGAQGEMTGIMLINAYMKSKNQHRKNILVPDTAHGTNPASIALCGFKPVALNSGDKGILTPDAVAAVMDDDTAGIMVTNPNTLGLFEENIAEIAEIIHKRGGLVYCDGANINAVMGIVQMGKIGIDVMHVNLHKTFSTPHGGGGPGAGPVCVKEHLAPFLPVPRVVLKDGAYSLSTNYPQTIGKVHSFYGNMGVLIRAYSYIRSMGGENLRKASELAVLNANYIKESLRGTFDLPFDDKPCMHECVFSDKKQEEFKVSTLNIAKRLIDYGFHPPTVYFPLVVHGAIMIEPTETESKESIDEFIAAMKAIAKEAEETPELLHNAPEIAKVKKLDETEAARNPKIAG